MAEAMPMLADAESAPAKTDEAAPAGAMAGGESAPAAPAEPRPPRRAPARRRWCTASSSTPRTATIAW